MNTMTPSTQEMTDGQINKTTDLLAVFRGYVDRFSNLIVRIISVNRSQTPEQALTATGRKQYVTAEVVAAMPKGTGAEAKVIFFKPDKSAYDKNGWISDDDLEKQYALRGLIPSDAYSLAAVNEADPAFGDEHPNTTHWKDSSGKWCYAAFNRWNDGERTVDVDRNDRDWNDSWWFAGLATLFISPPSSWGSFVWQAVRSNRPDSGRSRLALPTVRYTSCRQAIW